MPLNSNLYKHICLLCIVSLLYTSTFSQNFANKDYYLIDSLVLDNLTSHDKLIIDSCLTIYHKEDDDFVKIGALSHICDKIGDNCWIKFQHYLHSFILTKIELAKNEKEKKTIIPYLVYSLNNLALMELDNGNYPTAKEHYQQCLKSSIEISDSAGMARTYGGLSYMYKLQGKSKEALEYNTKSLEIFEKLGKEHGIAQSFQNLGDIHHMLGNTFIAKSSFEKAIAIYKKINNLYGEASCYNNLALINVSLGNVPEAIDLYIKSINIYEKTGSSIGVAISYTNMGDLYFKQKEIKKALESYSKSLEIYKKIDANPYQSFCFSKVAEVFLFNNEFDSALLYFYKSLQIDSLDNNTIGIARALNNIANLYFKLDDFEKAITLYEKALTLFKETDYKEATNSCRINLARAYYEIGSLKVAKKHSEKAFSKANELGYPKQIQDISIVLSELFKVKKDYKNSLEMYSIHIQMRDSVINLDNKALLIRKEFEDEYNKKTFHLKEQKLEDEITLNEQHEKILKQKYLAILLVSLLIIIALFVLWRSSKHKLKIKWLQEDVFKSQMKPHFLFNVLVSIQSLIVQKRDKDAIHYLAEIATYMRSNLNDVSLKNISIQKELKLAEQYLILEKLRFKEKLEFEIINLLTDKDLDIKVPPLITQPIIENSIVHGFKNLNYTGKVIIKAGVTNKKLHITIEDNGIGIIENNKESSKGLGIVRKRLKLFNSKNKLALKNQEIGVIAKLIIDTN